MLDRVAISHLRHRRATYFFGDSGPALPGGMEARWRLSPEDPHGWHANMAGFVEGPVACLPQFLAAAISCFGSYGADSWIDADEFGILFKRESLLAAHGFRLVDDWAAMICRRPPSISTSREVEVRLVESGEEIALAALVAEQTDRGERLDERDSGVQARRARFRKEQVEYGSRIALAFLHGRSVGTARLTDEELPVVVGVATLPRLAAAALGPPWSPGSPRRRLDSAEPARYT